VVERLNKTVSTSGFVFTGGEQKVRIRLPTPEVMLVQTAATLGFSARTAACLASCSFDPAVCNSASRRLALSRCSGYRSAFDGAISRARLRNAEFLVRLAQFARKWRKILISGPFLAALRKPVDWRNGGIKGKQWVSGIKDNRHSVRFLLQTGASA
jgi:hypothetical protein